MTSKEVKVSGDDQVTTNDDNIMVTSDDSKEPDPKGESGGKGGPSE